MQIQQTAVQSQRALSVSTQQAAAKDRERRILQLTIDEISQMEGEVNLYKGVGKMYGNILLPISLLMVFPFQVHDGPSENYGSGIESTGEGAIRRHYELEQEGELTASELCMLLT